MDTCDENHIHQVQKISKNQQKLTYAETCYRVTKLYGKMASKVPCHRFMNLNEAIRTELAIFTKCQMRILTIICGQGLVVE